MNTDGRPSWIYDTPAPAPVQVWVLQVEGTEIMRGSMVTCAARANRLGKNGCKNLSIVQA